MPEPARRSVRSAPPLDPSAVQRAYRLERAKRLARVKRDRARHRANLRFTGIVLLLLGLAGGLGYVAWAQIQELFGL